MAKRKRNIRVKENLTKSIQTVLTESDYNKLDKIREDSLLDMSVFVRVELLKIIRRNEI